MPHYWGKYSVQIQSKSPTNPLVSPGGGYWGLTLIGALLTIDHLNSDENILAKIVTVTI